MKSNNIFILPRVCNDHSASSFGILPHVCTDHSNTEAAHWNLRPNQNRKNTYTDPKIVTLSRYNYAESGKADIDYTKNSPHVPLRQIAEEKRRGKDLRVV
jgi:hypothetical protein